MATKPAAKKTPAQVRKTPAPPPAESSVGQPVEASAIQKAAADINTVLKVTPPLNQKLDDAALAKEIRSVAPQIKQEDELAPDTFKVLKALGWGAKAPVKKAAAPAKHKLGRMEILGRAIASGKKTPEKIIQTADSAYVKEGGTSNIPLFTSLFSDAKSLLRGLGLLKEEGDYILPPTA